eukprot:4993749-Pyramimonas_sp.AAC.1
MVSARLAAYSSSARNAMVGCLWPVARRARASPALASSARCPWGLSLIHISEPTRPEPIA